ncbi:hypothetical protein AAFF_G00039150 [Aldrovandia affinis]|uniref:Uncharacterized protein n=1 Tax=Aldrovandia affinis TaxID=143900 RepID=A0AAD7T5P5_9TELE|nr:hypothetical protein AAFF_G00039150 [Aldrovandia affinis]
MKDEEGQATQDSSCITTNPGFSSTEVARYQMHQQKSTALTRMQPGCNQASIIR